jgi:putative oxidoreductase
VTKNPVYSFFHTPGTVAPVFLRCALVVIFFYHGGQKAFGLFGGNGFAETVNLWTDGSGLGLSWVLASAAIVAEIGVVPLLLFGFLTRAAGFVIFVLMGGALYLIHGGESFLDIQFPILVMASGLALLFLGGGYLSIDRRISKSLLPEVGGLSY